MTTEIQLRVDPATASMPLKLNAAVSDIMMIDANRIKDIKIIKKSIDARQRKVMINLVVRVYIDEMPESTSIANPITYNHLPSDAPTCLIVGAGPAGLFAALRLIELGIKPIVLERGKNVDERRKDLARISREQRVDPESNYCFGEGGAGAYSDGKLYTRSKKRGNIDKILNVFHQHGASEDILIDAHPHIGTDKLPEVIKSIRNTILKCGGEINFSTCVKKLNLNDKKVTGVTIDSGISLSGPVILATGHSARDIYRMLQELGVKLEPKGIAVGVRLEHPQKLIDQIRYHSSQGRGKYLPAAEYTMTTQVKGRGVYSFCMCPGGFIIPAASDKNQLVVNGMSPSNRGTRWANSGMVVEVRPDDVPDETTSDELKMIKYQEEIELRFYNDANGTQNAPAQRMTDFVKGKLSADLPDSSYAPGIHSARIDKLLPAEVANKLKVGFEEFGKKQKGFLSHDAVLIGAETRTSSPVRIPRDDESLQHTQISGLFPCGEGAGYAGGIVSAAIDGERCAEAVAKMLK